MQNLVQVLKNTLIFHGEEITDTDLGFNLTFCDTSSQCDPKKFMDLLLSDHPNVTITVSKGSNNNWWITSGIVGYLEDSLCVFDNDLIAGWVLNQMGFSFEIHEMFIEEYFCKAMNYSIPGEQEDGSYFIPNCDPKTGTLLNWIEKKSNKYFAQINWSIEDLRSALLKENFKDSDENIERILGSRLARTLEELSIQSGWEVIYDSLYDVDGLEREMLPWFEEVLNSSTDVNIYMARATNLKFCEEVSMKIPPECAKCGSDDVSLLGSFTFDSRYSLYLDVECNKCKARTQSGDRHFFLCFELDKDGKLIRK
ncbi:hypothetical protein NW801_21990 [Brevibacillus laterosporus]|uniref:Uncharacterized protein n=1 Tax=Brevibacillus halotolerans TaxID=1507437 RepID=A0ABT4I3H7_9BACL|nr:MULTISPECIES: hypothetical protein [Brevibacillus]MCR8987664.1 hypothetical protein [Brevibacillus laterosporus]MCZ0833403.1 hypothetical protein [Brevibacillus halotolerans]